MRATALPALGALLLLSVPGLAAPPANPYEPQVKKGRAYLFGALKNERRLGRLALGALSLQKTAPATEPIEPELRRLIDRVGEAVDRNEAEFLSGGEWNYVAAVSLLCLVADDVNAHEQRVRKLVRLLVERQADVGAWGYQGGGPDTSQTQ